MEPNGTYEHSVKDLYWQLTDGDGRLLVHLRKVVSLFYHKTWVHNQPN
jgi:hypothetical protein